MICAIIIHDNYNNYRLDNNGNDTGKSDYNRYLWKIKNILSLMK